MDGFLPRTVTVARVAFVSALSGPRALGLLGIAAIPTLVELGLVAGRASPDALAQSAQSLFLSLTLAIVAIVVTLLVGVAQFRSEIEEDTLSYLWSRSIPREAVALGKYLGALGASVVLLLPLALLPLGIAGAAGAPLPSDGVPLAMIALTLLALVAYVAVFLFFGLVSRSALLLGVLFGFLWEELLPILPGSVPRLTVIYFLRSLGSDLVASGPLAGYPNPATVPGAVAAPLLAALAFLLLTSVALRYAEIAPERTSA